LSEGCEPLISKQDARLHYRLGWVASPGALPRERFSSLARLYGPAVRCKLNLQSGGDWSCASVSGPYAEQIAPGHHGYPRASDLILG
jgi:hypothetical protein